MVNQKIARHMRADMNPIFDSGLRTMAAECIPRHARVAEIGVYAGESTRIFMETGRVDTLWAVDIWLDNYNPLDAWGAVHPMRDVRITFFDNIQEFYPRVLVFMAHSTFVAAIAPNEFFDMVYIDANHDYEQVIDDIIAWMPKVKHGGFIAGHDYQGSWPGVIRAVNELFGAPDKLYEDTSWIKRL